MRWIVGLVLLAACSTTTTRYTPDSGTTSHTTLSARAGLGDTITLAGLDTRVAVTLVKIVDPSASRSDQPAKGSRYVAVQFSVRNVGTKALSEAPFIASRVKDRLGQSYDPAIVASTTAGPDLPGEIKDAPGDLTLGFVVFELPVSAKVAAVEWDAGGGFGDTGVWRL